MNYFTPGPPASSASGSSEDPGPSGKRHLLPDAAARTGKTAPAARLLGRRREEGHPVVATSPSRNSHRQVDIASSRQGRPLLPLAAIYDLKPRPSAAGGQCRGTRNTIRCAEAMERSAFTCSARSPPPAVRGVFREDMSKRRRTSTSLLPHQARFRRHRAHGVQVRGASIAPAWSWATRAR